MNHLLIVEERQRRQLKEMLQVLFPEYKHITVGQDYVSMSAQKAISLDMNWKKYHWFILLLGEALKRLYALGRKDEEWLRNIVHILATAVMHQGSEHPIETIYREYTEIITALKEKRNKPNYQRV